MCNQAGRARSIIGLALAGFGTFGCASRSVHTEAEVPLPRSVDRVAVTSPPALEASTPGSVEAVDLRVGETTLHRFSGTFSKSALLLKEEVVAVDRDTFTVRYTLDEGASQSELLVTRARRSERIVSVIRVENDREISATVADYEKMIKKTLFVPDRNQGKIAHRSQTCLVGSTEHACEIAEYKVYVADKEARLSVARSPELDRDVSGEVVAVDGTMIYHAELLEVQGSPDSHDEEVAIVTELE